MAAMFVSPEAFWYEFVFLFLCVGGAQTAQQFRFLVRFTDRGCGLKCCVGYALLLFGVAALELEAPMPRFFQAILEMAAVYGFVFFALRQPPVRAALAAVLVQTVLQLSGMLSGAMLNFAAPLLGRQQAIAFAGGALAALATLLFSWFCFRALAQRLRLEALETRYLPVLLPPFFLTLYLTSAISDLEFRYVTFDVTGRIPAAFGDLQILLFSVASMATMTSVLYAYWKLTEYHAQQARQLLLAKERDWQKAYVEEAGQRYAKTRAFRHDIHNHLLVLRGLLAEQQLAAADAYLAKIETAAACLSFPAHTGNAALDVLLSSKFEAARQDGIAIDCALQMPARLGADDYELCVIFANAIDNARKACAHAAQKYIRVTSRRQGDFLLLVFENSCASNAYDKGSGQGLENVRAVAKKYGGAVQLQVEAERFALRVLLQLS